MGQVLASRVAMLKHSRARAVCGEAPEGQFGRPSYLRLAVVQRGSYGVDVFRVAHQAQRA